MTDRTQPKNLVRYTLEPGMASVTLRQVVDFARRLEEIGAGSFLDHALQGQPSQGLYVYGPLPDPIPQEPGAADTRPTFGPWVRAKHEENLVRLVKRWVEGSLAPSEALRAIAIELGVDLHPETKGDDED